MNDLTTAPAIWDLMLTKFFMKTDMSVEDFEKKYSVTLPEDIVTMVGYTADTSQDTQLSGH